MRSVERWAWLFLFACAEPAPTSDAGAPLPDAGPPADAGSADAGETADAGVPFEPELGDRIRVTTARGAIEGELLHVYDHRLWWAAEEKETLLLFDVRGFAPWPDDDSIRLVARSDVLAIERLDPTRPYREELRRRGITIDGLPLAGESFVITAHESYHLEEDGYGDFAWDLVKVENGARFTGDGTRNEDYRIWGERVVLPTGGVVVELEDGAPDHPPGPWPDGAVNNLIGVSLGGQYYLYLLHLAQGSIPPAIAVGTELGAGAYVGNVGNSGVSLEPHLHVVVLWYDPISQRSWSVPSEMRDVVVRTGTVSDRRAFVDPPSGVFLMD